LGDVNSQIVDEIMSTGAVITGRGTFEAAKGWGGDHHDGGPILRPQPQSSTRLGRRMARRALCDELEIHLILVLMGDGRRLFEHRGIEQRQLERIRVLEGDHGVTHLRYRVLR
jgi:hypothetical protein